MQGTRIPPRNSSIVYPESDGKPMADNTLQFQWITVLKGNIDALFPAPQDVFVAGDLFWYPVEGFPEIVIAPDVLVAFGRPKGQRGSYRQWEEGDIAPQVVFEILSPCNTPVEMGDKRDFYEEYGVEEYYFFDPDSNSFRGFIRKGGIFCRLRPAHNHVSPRLGIRFDLSGKEMVVFGPDGEPFLTFEQLKADRDRERQVRQDAEQQRDRERLVRLDVEKQRDLAHQQRDLANQRVARMAELTSKALAQKATPAELQELDQLLKTSAP